MPEDAVLPTGKEATPLPTVPPHASIQVIEDALKQAQDLLGKYDTGIKQTQTQLQQAMVDSTVLKGQIALLEQLKAKIEPLVTAEEPVADKIKKKK